MFQKKTTWKISSSFVENFPVLEMTDSVSGGFNPRELYLEFLRRMPTKGNHFSISQSFLPSQNRKQEYAVVARELSKINPLLFAATKEFHSLENVGSAGQDFVVHTVQSDLDAKNFDIFFVVIMTCGHPEA